MTREEAHNLVDKLFDGYNSITETQTPEPGDTYIGDQGETPRDTGPVRQLPEGKRVVRTSTSGDRVYFLDEVKKTRQWVTNPEVLDSLDFELGDVVEVNEDELLKYQMGPALYKRVDE